MPSFWTQGVPGALVRLKSTSTTLSLTASTTSWARSHSSDPTVMPVTWKSRTYVPACACGDRAARMTRQNMVAPSAARVGGSDGQVRGGRARTGRAANEVGLRDRSADRIGPHVLVLLVRRRNLGCRDERPEPEPPVGQLDQAVAGRRRDLITYDGE